MAGLLGGLAQPQHQQPEHRAEDERRPPAVRGHAVLAEGRGAHRAQRRRQHHAERHREEDRAGPEPAVARRRDLRHVGVRDAGLPAVREPLREPRHQQQHRRPDADLLVPGDQGDHQGGDGHDRDGDDQHRLTAPGVGEPAEDQPAQRPGEEADGEDGQRRQQRRGAVRLVEEVGGYVGREDRVEGPVEPLQHVAGDGRPQGAELPALGSPVALGTGRGVGLGRRRGRGNRHAGLLARRPSRGAPGTVTGSWVHGRGGRPAAPSGEWRVREHERTSGSAFRKTNTGHVRHRRHR